MPPRILRTLWVSMLLVATLLASPTAAVEVDAAYAARLQQRLSATADPVAAEAIREALARATPDALAAFDLWYALAREASQTERRALARRRAAVLALMLGQFAKLERLLEDAPEDDALLAWIARLVSQTGDIRNASVLLSPLLDDAASVARLAAWWSHERVCPADADPLLCGGMGP